MQSGCISAAAADTNVHSTHHDKEGTGPRREFRVPLRALKVPKPRGGVVHTPSVLQSSHQNAHKHEQSKLREHKNIHGLLKLGDLFQQERFQGGQIPHEKGWCWKKHNNVA